MGRAEARKVLAERGIDFVPLAAAALDGRPAFTLPSPRGGEARFVTVAAHAGRLFALVWTRRDGVTRIVTARRARHGEARHHRALFG